MDIFDLTVADIMQTDVVTARPDLSVAKLLDLLEERDISGVPVVGPDDTVAGVVSLSDVARAAGEEAATGEAPSRRTPDAAVRDRPSGFFRMPDGPLLSLPAGLPKTKLGARAVRDIMTPATFSVRPDASVPELARFLDQGGVHRALVLEGSVLAGIVTAMDVVRVLAGAGAPSPT